MQTENLNEQLLDNFAGIALNALIQKLPLLDTEGAVGQKMESDQIARIKKELAGSAYEYACYMLIARKNSIDWLNENAESFSTKSKEPE